MSQSKLSSDTHKVLGRAVNKSEKFGTGGSPCNARRPALKKSEIS
jgi:hypothetical protein